MGIRRAVTLDSVAEMANIASLRLVRHAQLQMRSCNPKSWRLEPPRRADRTRLHNGRTRSPPGKHLTPVAWQRWDTCRRRAGGVTTARQLNRSRPEIRAPLHLRCVPPAKQTAAWSLSNHLASVSLACFRRISHMQRYWSNRVCNGIGEYFLCCDIGAERRSRLLVSRQGVPAREIQRHETH